MAHNHKAASEMSNIQTLNIRSVGVISCPLRSSGSIDCMLCDVCVETALRPASGCFSLSATCAPPPRAGAHTFPTANAPSVPLPTPTHL